MISRIGVPKSMSPKQEIWTLKKFKDSGDGATGAAPSLQLKNAQNYFITKLLHDIGNEKPTVANAKALDAALASCEDVPDQVALDGNFRNKGKQINAVDLARKLRTKIRETLPELFKGTTLEPANAVK